MAEAPAVPAAAPSASSVATTQPFRPPFLASSGDPAIPWDRWIDMFEDWILAIGFPTGEQHAARKAALLRASLGAEGFRIYSSLVVDRRESYDDAKTHLAEHFDRKASTFYQRAQFTRRQQRSGESISQFVAALRDMAPRCEFTADELNNRVRDQFVARVASDEIRKRLFQEPATKSLTEILNLATTMERSLSEVPALHSSVNRVSYTRRSDNRTKGIPCSNCGLFGHKPKTTDCPAMGKKCAKCSKLNHFAKCCKSPALHSVRQAPTGTVSRNRPNTNQISSVTDSESVESVYVSTVSGQETSAIGQYKHVACKLNGIYVDLILDLGARVSLLSIEHYKRKEFEGCELHQPDLVLRGYNGSHIPCIGYITVDVTISDVTVPRFRFYVV